MNTVSEERVKKNVFDEGGEVRAEIQYIYSPFTVRSTLAERK